MAAPVTPQDFLDNVPSVDDPPCTRIKKALIDGPTDFSLLISWMFNADGSFSTQFISELCAALNSSGCTGGTVTTSTTSDGSTTSTTTSAGAGCGNIDVTVGGTGDANLDRTVQWGAPHLDGSGHCYWQGIGYHYDFLRLLYNTGATRWEVLYNDAGTIYTAFYTAPGAYATPIGQAFTLNPAPNNPWGANPATFAVAAA